MKQSTRVAIAGTDRSSFKYKRFFQIDTHMDTGQSTRREAGGGEVKGKGVEIRSSKILLNDQNNKKFLCVSVCACRVCVVCVCVCVCVFARRKLSLYGAAFCVQPDTIYTI